MKRPTGNVRKLSLRSPERGLKSIFTAVNYTATASLRSPERGLKCRYSLFFSVQYVAPFAGAWIEIELYRITMPGRLVAPFAGAWIEIAHLQGEGGEKWSLRSPERGLKFVYV